MMTLASGNKAADLDARAVGESSSAQTYAPAQGTALIPITIFFEITVFWMYVSAMCNVMRCMPEADQNYNFVRSVIMTECFLVIVMKSERGPALNTDDMWEKHWSGKQKCQGK